MIRMKVDCIMYEEYYYVLFINGEPVDYIDYDKGMYRLENKAVECVELPLFMKNGNTTEEIKSSKDLNRCCEYHQGCWSPTNLLRDEFNNEIDIKIIENTKINNFKSYLNQTLLKDFCEKNRINIK